MVDGEQDDQHHHAAQRGRQDRRREVWQARRRGFQEPLQAEREQPGNRPLRQTADRRPLQAMPVVGEYRPAAHGQKGEGHVGRAGSRKALQGPVQALTVGASAALVKCLASLRQGWNARLRAD